MVVKFFFCMILSFFSIISIFGSILNPKWQAHDSENLWGEILILVEGLWKFYLWSENWFLRYLSCNNSHGRFKINARSLVWLSKVFKLLVTSCYYLNPFVLQEYKTKFVYVPVSQFQIAEGQDVFECLKSTHVVLTVVWMKIKLLGFVPLNEYEHLFKLAHHSVE